MTDQMTYFFAYMEDKWPMMVFLIGAIWGVVIWLKRQFIDNVYATKAEVRAATEELEGKMKEHEDKDNARYIALTKQMNENHDEMKDLVISTMSKK